MKSSRLQRFSPRFLPPVPCLALLFLCALLSSGCDATASAEKVDQDRVRELHGKLDRLGDQIDRLPRGNPEQMTRHQIIINKYNFTKINFKSKFNARLGSITPELYEATDRQLKEIEELIREYPR